MTAAEVLALPLKDAVTTRLGRAGSVRQYLALTLATLWDEGDSFSGKRPLGDSDWVWPIYEALVRAHLVRGTFDDEGYLSDFPDRNKADRLVRAAILSMGSGLQ